MWKHHKHTAVQEVNTNLQCWPCISTSPRRCRPHGTGRCSGVAGGCSRTPGCATLQLLECWSRSFATPLPPPGRSPAPRWTHPVWCRQVPDRGPASGRHHMPGAVQRWIAPGVNINNFTGWKHKWWQRQKQHLMLCITVYVTLVIRFGVYVVRSFLIPFDQWYGQWCFLWDWVFSWSHSSPQTSLWTEWFHCVESVCQTLPSQVGPGLSYRREDMVC